MGKEQPADYYNQVYGASGSSYRQKPEHCAWYPLWKEILREVKDRRHSNDNIDRVIELGCGPGHFAQMLIQSGLEMFYDGYDFSPVAIEMAIERTKTLHFHVWDCREELTPIPESPAVYVMCEFLEHIGNDLEVLNGIPEGQEIVASVPKHDDPAHVRTFKDMNAVEERYHTMVSFHDIIEVKNQWFLFTGERKNCGECDET